MSGHFPDTQPITAANTGALARRIIVLERELLHVIRKQAVTEAVLYSEMEATTPVRLFSITFCATQHGGIHQETSENARTQGGAIALFRRAHSGARIVKFDEINVYDDGVTIRPSGDSK